MRSSIHRFYKNVQNSHIDVMLKKKVCKCHECSMLPSFSQSTSDVMFCNVDDRNS